MKQLLRTELVFCSLFALLSAVMLVIGRQQEQPALFDSLKPCYIWICYLGIMPLDTTSDETRTILEAMPGIKFNPNTNIVSNPPGFKGSAAILYDAQTTARVGGIVLQIRTADVSVGSLVLQFGVPCAVASAASSRQILVYFRKMSVFVSADKLGADQYLKPNTPVDRITVSDSVKSCDLASSHLLPWKGFIHYVK